MQGASAKQGAQNQHSKVTLLTREVNYTQVNHTFPEYDPTIQQNDAAPAQ